MAYILEQKPKQTQRSNFSSFSLLQIFILPEKILNDVVSWSNHVLLIKSFFVFFFWRNFWHKTISGCFCWTLISFWHMKSPNDIHYNYWYICLLNFWQYYLPLLLLFHKYFFVTGKWQTIKIMNHQHITLIFVLIAWLLFFSGF